jgi:hypothetical protein
LTKATPSITHGSLSPRHELSYNDKTMLNNLVRISELHQKQSHWTIENDLYGTPEKLATVAGLMNRAIPFATLTERVGRLRTNSGLRRDDDYDERR